MIGIPNKLLGITGGIAGLTASGLGIAYLVSNNSQDKNVISTPTSQPVVNEEQEPNQSITDLLGKDKRELLKANENEQEWNDNWKKFKNKYNENNITNSSWAFNEWSTALKGEVAVQAFKEKCQTNSETKVKDKNDALYLDVKEYCTKEAKNE